MKQEPQPRREVYDTYWYFAAERLRVMMERATGKPGPWTEDPILRGFKFCNTYRAADRVSQYLIAEVCYSSKQLPADRAFQIVAFRTFSRPETWERLKLMLGHTPVIEDLRSGRLRRALDDMRSSGERLYTGAFILCANLAYGFEFKHQNHVALFEDMFVRSNLGEKIIHAESLEDVFNLLREFPLMGDFMSYQTAIDLNYSEILDFNENDFTAPGPGALRGLKKVFKSLGDYSPSEAIQWMVEHQDAEFERLGFEFDGLWGRPLHAIDCQGLFCETDKYSRERFPNLRSERKRIKARFVPSAKPLAYFFPPKWGLNDKALQAPANPGYGFVSE